jgi:hypothetical protein
MNRYSTGLVQTRLQRFSYDGVVAYSGGDFTTIQAADDSLDAGDFSLLVKTGTYAGWTTSTDDAYVLLAPGTVITSGITLSGANIVLEIGPGCDIQGLITMSGVGCHLIIRNACDLDGILMSGNFGYVNGGGWDSLVDGTTANHAFSITGTDCVVENVACQTTAGGATAFDGFNITGPRTTVRKAKVVNSDSDGFAVSVGGADLLIEGCVILNADNGGISTDGPRNRILGNWITKSSTGAGIALDSQSDNSLVVGNVVQMISGGHPISLIALANNCVVQGNRTDGAVDDSSTGSTVGNNDETAF